jgi:riboflavin transporter FmnP
MRRNGFLSLFFLVCLFQALEFVDYKPRSPAAFGIAIVCSIAIVVAFWCRLRAARIVVLVSAILELLISAWRVRSFTGLTESLIAVRIAVCVVVLLVLSTGRARAVFSDKRAGRFNEDIVPKL